MKTRVIFLGLLVWMLMGSIAYAIDSKDNWTFKKNVTVEGNTMLETFNYGAKETVASDAYTATLNPAPTAYDEGFTVTFKAYTANTGAASLNVNELGAKSIKILNDQTPGNRCLEADGVYNLVYDGTSFQLTTPCSN